jgi:hypothetical protein
VIFQCLPILDFENVYSHNGRERSITSAGGKHFIRKHCGGAYCSSNNFRIEKEEEEEIEREA